MNLQGPHNLLCLRSWFISWGWFQFVKKIWLKLLSFWRLRWAICRVAVWFCDRRVQVLFGRALILFAFLCSLGCHSGLYLFNLPLHIWGEEAIWIYLEPLCSHQLRGNTIPQWSGGLKKHLGAICYGLDRTFLGKICRFALNLSKFLRDCYWNLCGNEN